MKVNIQVQCTTKPLDQRAAGPWVEHTLHLDVSVDTDSGVRLVKGSHIVVPRLFDHPYPYIFQNEDNRVMFAIPYEGDYTLLGTTEVEIEGDPDGASIDDSEITYICNAINRYMKTPVKASDIVWSYTGVRPLFDDHSKNASKVTRDYVLQMDDDGPPILSVFGGKLTTYRKLSEQAVDILKAPMGFSQNGWTTGTTLPGGDIENGDFVKFLTRCKQAYAWLDEAVLNDYARNYGSEIDRLLDGCSSIGDLGKDFGGGLFECEVAYLMKYEWAETAEDILWRRTKKGLRVPEGTDVHLQSRINDHKSYLNSWFEIKGVRIKGVTH